MKRSGFTRPVYERPPRPALAPVELRGVIRPIGDGAAPAPKQPPARSESYRRWVASLPCLACGIHGLSQAAHPNQGRGLGQKSSDLDCFPLCCDRPGQFGCHGYHDRLVFLSLEDRRSLEVLYIATTLRLALAAKRPEIAA